jgi:hypothetical protein
MTRVKKNFARGVSTMRDANRASHSIHETREKYVGATLTGRNACHSQRVKMRSPRVLRSGHARVIETLSSSPLNLPVVACEARDERIVKPSRFHLGER